MCIYILSSMDIKCYTNYRPKIKKIATMSWRVSDLSTLDTQGYIGEHVLKWRTGAIHTIIGVSLSEPHIDELKVRIYRLFLEKCKALLWGKPELTM